MLRIRCRSSLTLVAAPDAGSLVAGVDEVGRGPLAGPVVAAAVILPQPIDGIADSKQLSPKERAFVVAGLVRVDEPRMSDEEWYEEIERRLDDFDVEDADAETVYQELLAELER